MTQEEEKPPLALIPYVAGVSECIKRACRNFNVTPPCTIACHNFVSSRYLQIPHCENAYLEVYFILNLLVYLIYWRRYNLPRICAYIISFILAYKYMDKITCACV